MSLLLESTEILALFVVSKAWPVLTHDVRDIDAYVRRPHSAPRSAVCSSGPLTRCLSVRGAHMLNRVSPESL